MGEEMFPGTGSWRDWWVECSPTSKLTQAGCLVLEALSDAETPLSALQVRAEAHRLCERANTATTRQVFYTCVKLGAVQPYGRSRRVPKYRITAAGEALLHRIWGADPDKPAWPDLR